MLSWSYAFLAKFMTAPNIVGAGLVVASLNALVQILFSLIFAKHSHIRGSV